jgi:hypothetical protein
MEAESEERQVEPTPVAAVAAHRTFALEVRLCRIAWLLLQVAVAWVAETPMPMQVMRVAMPAVKATAPLDKEETEERKIPAVPVARRGLDQVTTETAVALVLVAMVPLTLATTLVPAVAVAAATTAVAVAEVTASLPAHSAAAAAVADQV